MREDLGLANRFTWLAVARFSWEKDWQTLLRAMSQTEGNSLLLAVGDGKLAAEVGSFADTMGLQNRVRFLGKRTDVENLMSAADGYVMSSVVEGLPMVLLEAASCELPIVATNVGGASEIVIDEISGYLVESGCAFELALLMNKVQALNDGDRRSMGVEGRQRVLAHYDLSVVAEKWDSLYRELLSKKRIAHQAGESS
jgi:glycosyltransferase involved in cell wall biosynthesis